MSEEILIKSLSGDYQEELTIGKHTLILDASEKEGGANSGPSPHDLLTGALLGCKAMTMRMYGKRKGWDLTGLQLKAIQHNIDRKNTRFEVVVSLPEHLDKEQKERLLDISKKCPVHRILEGQIEVITTLDGNLPTQ